MNIPRPQSLQPLPTHAKRVFKGQIFDVYQWEQKLFDGTKATFEKIKRADTVGILPVTSEGKIILSKQEQPGIKPFVGTVGGRIDEGEDPLSAAKRELLEETGYAAKEWILWDAVQVTEKIDWVVYNFIAKGLVKEKEPELEGGEKIELMEVTFEGFLRILAQPNCRDTEIKLKLFELGHNPKELEKTRNLFSPNV